MQQVFSMVNSLLAKNAETRRRSLAVRTYKVASAAALFVISLRIIDVMCANCITMTLLVFTDYENDVNSFLNTVSMQSNSATVST